MNKLLIMYSYFGIAYLIHIYQFLLCTFELEDIISFKLNSLISGWSFLHLILNLFIGFLFPNDIIFASILGIIWEIYEYLYSKNILHLQDLYKKICKNTSNITLHNKYDIVVNIFGLLLGRYIRFISVNDV